MGVFIYLKRILDRVFLLMVWVFLRMFIFNIVFIMVWLVDIGMLMMV